MKQLAHKVGRGPQVQVHILQLLSLQGERYHLDTRKPCLHRVLGDVTRLLSMLQISKGMAVSC